MPTKSLNNKEIIVGDTVKYLLDNRGLGSLVEIIGFSSTNENKAIIINEYGEKKEIECDRCLK